MDLEKQYSITGKTGFTCEIHFSVSYINAFFCLFCVSLLYTPMIIQAFCLGTAQGPLKTVAVILYKKIDKGISEEDKGHQGFSHCLTKQ